MAQIVYIGNKLFKSRGTLTVLETIEPKLREISSIVSYSSHTNFLLKILNSTYGVFLNYFQLKLVILDLYSTNYRYFAFYIHLLCRLLNKPYIIYMHGGNLPIMYNKHNFIFRNILSNAKKIIAPSNYLYNYFKEKYPNIYLIPSVIETEKYPLKTERFNNTNPKILYIRGFGEVYNPQMIIKAIKIIVEKFPKVQVSMLGHDIDGTLEKCKKLVNQLNLSGNVIFLEKMTRDNWVQFSTDHSIMVSTPNIDNLPISVIEGMLLGMPVVSTDVGGIGYIIENEITGLLVEKNNHEELAFQINKLLEDKQLFENISKNSRIVGEKYSWINLKDRWENILAKFV
jgi:glycosyltransferase involved in cell wall biosynthesis